MSGKCRANVGQKTIFALRKKRNGIMATVKIILRGRKEKGFARFRLICGRGKE